MSYGLLDGHDVCLANVAEPFSVAYICKVFSMFEVSSRSRHASWTLRLVKVANRNTNECAVRVVKGILRRIDNRAQESCLPR